MSLPPSFDLWKLASPPYLDGYPDEQCDICHSDLGEVVTMVKGSGQFVGYELLLCEDCAAPQERCDQCGYYRCACPCEGCGRTVCSCP